MVVIVLFRLASLELFGLLLFIMALQSMLQCCFLVQRSVHTLSLHFRGCKVVLKKKTARIVDHVVTILIGISKRVYPLSNKPLYRVVTIPLEIRNRNLFG